LLKNILKDSQVIYDPERNPSHFQGKGFFNMKGKIIPGKTTHFLAKSSL